MEQAIISGIAFNRDEAKISLMGVEDRPGIAYAILGPVAAANVDVDMIVQNIGASGHTDFSFTVNRGEYQKALDVLAGEKGKGFTAREIIGDNRICKVSLVGIGMRSHVGIAAKMFKTLADEQINIQMISTSEIKTSVVIDEKYLELAVRVLHRAFELDQAAAGRSESGSRGEGGTGKIAFETERWPSGSKALPCTASHTPKSVSRVRPAARAV